MDVDEKTREDIQELLRGVRTRTKYGGYEEVPEDIAKEQARRVGLEESEIPGIRISEETDWAYVERTPVGEVEIVIPRRQSKRQIPKTLRHELAHYKLGHIGYGEEELFSERIRAELEAFKLQGGGRLISEDLASIVLTQVLEEGMPRRASTSLVMEEARNLGASEHSITSARRWLKGYWRRLRELEDYL